MDDTEHPKLAKSEPLDWVFFVPVPGAGKTVRHSTSLALAATIAGPVRVIGNIEVSGRDSGGRP